MRLGLFQILLLIFIIISTCIDLEFDPALTQDPRLGELGRVRFASKGCEDSTLLAVGSQAKLTIEPQLAHDLPHNLTVTSTNPNIIEAYIGVSPADIIIKARREGSSEIELYTDQMLYDWLGFEAVLASSVDYESPEAVFAGGRLYLKVKEVYGTCGQDCPLLGDSFIIWSAWPVEALIMRSDRERVATFTSVSEGRAYLTGQEPVTSTPLIDHAIEIISPDKAGELEATITIMLPDETLLESKPLPANVPVGSLIQLRFQAEAKGVNVPLTIYEVNWQITRAITSLTHLDSDSNLTPEGPIFSADAEGEVKIEIEVPLIAREGYFEIVVHE